MCLSISSCSWLLYSAVAIAACSVGVSAVCAALYFLCRVHSSLAIGSERLLHDYKHRCLLFTLCF